MVSVIPVLAGITLIMVMAILASDGTILIMVGDILAMAGISLIMEEVTPLVTITTTPTIQAEGVLRILTE